MSIVDILLTLVVIGTAGFLLYYYVKKKKNEKIEETVNVDDKTYTLDKMKEFVKRRLNEITKVNLYDIGLSEEELKRRKNKKYELKKALKGCTYGDVNDKKYVKELIFDLLEKEYGVRDSPEYNAWRSEVVSRDKVCQCCGSEKYPVAHHVFSYENYPKLRVDPNNGIRLCKWCHGKYHSHYGITNANPKTYTEFINRFGTK